MKQFEVIIIGGSYSGLAAAMALGRSLREVLVIDSGKPCNIQTPRSHNFLTQDGKTPLEISLLAREQVEKYDSVTFVKGTAIKGLKTENGFDIQTDSGEIFQAKKLIFATGVKDMAPDISGYAECWGISVLHCPYCHGYEVRCDKNGILGNGEYGFEFSVLISNWTKNLTLFTNGVSTLTEEQTAKLGKHNIQIVETAIDKLEQENGYIKNIIFRDGTKTSLKALYARSAFQQQSDIPAALGCELTNDGYIKINAFQQTSVPGVYACGDNASRIRTVANAVAMGTASGMAASKAIISEEF